MSQLRGFSFTMILLGALLAPPTPASAPSRPAVAPGSPPSGRAAGREPGLRAVYLGQDGHDYCSPDGHLGPDDIQDLHVRLEGLAPNWRIEEASITRAGGGEWTYSTRPEPTPHFRAQLLRDGRAPVADLYLEPSHDDRQFDLHIELRDAAGMKHSADVHCGRSDPNLFMPQAILRARWVGQEGHDLTGLGPAAGPDGCQDARIDLEGVSQRLEIRSIQLDAAHVGRWECGRNPERVNAAELVWAADDSSRASLFFSPGADLGARHLRLKLTYENGRSQSISLTAGKTDPSMKMATSQPVDLNDGLAKLLQVQWAGQVHRDTTPENNPHEGQIHLKLRGLPPGTKILAAAINDAVGGFWAWCPREAQRAFYPSDCGAADLIPVNASADRQRFALMQFGHPERSNGTLDSLPSLFGTPPLFVEPHTADGAADLYLPPVRDERKTHLILRLLLSDAQGGQSTTVVGFEGGTCDLTLCGDSSAATSAQAHPSDDLSALVARGGHIHLSPGIYKLTAPLRLAVPIQITGSRDAVMQFSQPAAAPPWQAAIELAASNITLKGFSVRFATPVRWDLQSPGAAAVLKAVPGRRTAAGQADPLLNLTVESMDIESAPLDKVPEPGREQPSADLMRFAAATCGRIVGNVLRGGSTEVTHGPWQISDNTYRGAMPGTMVWDTFAAHWAHDLMVARNRVAPVEPRGKTWRFFVLTQAGNQTCVADNTVQNIGMKDEDKLQNPNAPEIVLTESYRLNYEGRPAGVWAQGRIVRIPMVMYGGVEPGSVLSILSGPHAGEHYVIAQPLSPTAFLLDQPLPPALWNTAFAISIGHGFLNGTWERNTVDARGGGSALLVLAGSHWNQRVADNHLLGGREAMRIGAEATECPGPWGWSRTPLFDLTLDHNLVEDARSGIDLNVSGDPHARSTAGRRYLTADVQGNTIRWSGQFLRAGHRPPDRASPLPRPIDLAGSSGPDDAQMRVRLADNALDVPAGVTPGPAVIVGQATLQQH